MTFINDNRLALSIPAEQIEQGALDQIENILELECLKRLAIMPDVHAGYDMPIGGVALLEGYISPSFVGYDIGCGMCHINTGMSVKDCGLESHESRDSFLEKLRGEIPVGFAMRENDLGIINFSSASGDEGLNQRVRSKVGVQHGTLGGGNHFLEIGVNNEGQVGITIHSGSRRSGWEIGEWYMKQGRLLSLETDLGRAYLEDMNWALEYALSNRMVMMNIVVALIEKESKGLLGSPFTLLENLVNENHNHATILDDGSILHRKGATPAEAGQLGIIPANQRDGVYITRGLGNQKFLSSASHGAGRSMSRGQARRNISLESFREQMGGISCRTDEDVLDEAPDAYKDIKKVLEAQNGILVDVIDHFKPIIVLKG